MEQPHLREQRPYEQSRPHASVSWANFARRQLTQNIFVFAPACAICVEVQARVAAEPVAGASGHHASNDFSRYIKGDFSHYIKGLCALCNNGNFDQTLAMLFRAYSSAADHCVVTRDEVSAILASHVVYADSEVRYRVRVAQDQGYYGRGSTLRAFDYFSCSEILARVDTYPIYSQVFCAV